MNLLNDKGDTVVTRTFQDRSTQALFGLCMAVNEDYKLTGSNYDT